MKPDYEHKEFQNPRCLKARSRYSEGKFTYNRSTGKVQQFGDFTEQFMYCDRKKKDIKAAACCLMHVTGLIRSKLRHLPYSANVAATVGEEIRQMTRGYLLLEHMLCGPGEYLRYHDLWRSETQQAVSVIAFLHWLETGDPCPLSCVEVEKKLQMGNLEFGLDVEDYLVGICCLSSDLTQHTLNQVLVGDYDCLQRVMVFLTNLHASSQLLVLESDLFSEKRNEMENDLKKLQEVFCEVNMQGISKEV